MDVEKTSDACSKLDALTQDQRTEVVGRLHQHAQEIQETWDLSMDSDARAVHIAYKALADIVEAR